MKPDKYILANYKIRGLPAFLIESFKLDFFISALDFLEVNKSCQIKDTLLTVINYRNQSFEVHRKTLKT